MTILRVVGITALVLLVFLMAVAVLLVATFDVNRHLPAIAEEVRHATGRALDIGHGSLGVSLTRGLSFELEGAVLGDDAHFSTGPFLRVSRLSVRLDPWAFLRERRMVFSDILLESPEMVVIRAADGSVNAATIGAAPAVSGGQQAATSPRGGGSPAAAAIPAFLAGKVRVKNGTFRYEDRMMTPPLSLTVSALDITLTGFSLDGATPFSLAGAVFADKPNATFQGTVALDIPGAMVLLRGIEGTIAVDRVRPDLLAATFPMLAPAGLTAVQGTITTSVREARLGAAGLAALDADLAADLKGLSFAGGNAVAAILGSLPVGGLTEFLAASLPPAVAEDMRRGTTLVDSVGLRARVDAAAAHLEALEVKARDFGLTCRGDVFLTGTLDLSGEMALSADLTRALESRVGSLADARDGEGRVRIPMTVRGPVTMPKVRVDSNWLTGVLLGQAAAGLGEKLGGAGAADAAGALINSLFKKR